MNSPIPGTKIQGLMFPKALYTPARAASWAVRNGFEGSAPDVGSATATMIRVRAKGATRFVKGSFKTVPISDGVKAVVGVPVPVARKNPAKRRRINGDVLPFRRRGAPVPMKHYVGDSDEDVSDAPTVERAIRAPRSFSVSDMVARGHAWEADRSRGYQSTWYPDGARYGQRIVSIEQSGGKFRVMFGMAGRDDNGRFEAKVARGSPDRPFKTEGGAKRAALKWLEGDAVAARANPRKKFRRNTPHTSQEATMAGRSKSRRNPPVSTPDIKLHKDGRVTFWSVYDQQWVKTADLSDQDLASMRAAERKKVQAHVAKHGGARSNPRPPAKSYSIRPSRRQGARVSYERRPAKESAHARATRIAEEVAREYHLRGESLNHSSLPGGIAQIARVGDARAAAALAAAIRKQAKGNPRCNPEWTGTLYSASTKWLEKAAAQEYQAQLQAWLKSGKKRSTMRYSVPEWHDDLVKALGFEDPSTFLALKHRHMMYE